MKEDDFYGAYDSWLSKHGGYLKHMTLRDYFAANAMQSLLASIEPGNEHQVPLVPTIAYEMADAMLKVKGDK